MVRLWFFHAETGGETVSIIDGMLNSKEDVMKVLGIAEPLMQAALNRRKFTPVQKKVIGLMQEGLALADIFDISKEQRDAVFVTACKLLQVGKTKQARDVLITLFQLKPSDARVLYALAGT